MANIFKTGERLKELRISRDITRQELANLFQVSKTYIANLENNKSEPTLIILVKYAKFFNTRVNYILGIYDIKSIK